MDMELGTPVMETDNMPNNNGGDEAEAPRPHPHPSSTPSSSSHHPQSQSGPGGGGGGAEGFSSSGEIRKTLDENMSQDQHPSCQGDAGCGAAGGGSGSIKDVVIKMLDEMDGRVEKLRSDAMTLDNEKDDILSSLDAFGNAELVFQLEGIERDEINRYLDRLVRRAGAVQVGISAERSPPQMEALHKVNNMIDTLIRDLKEDAIIARRRCISYINACSEQVSPSIPDIDSKFESAVLGCSVEDQKRIRKRLTGLHSYFKSTAQTFAVMEEDEEEEAIAVERSLQKK